MTITIKIKNVYGNDLLYPICNKAQLFTKMLGKKTLGTQDIANIQKLGYAITIQTPSI
jgi:hypothetical protein